jgi:hypothetical protein
VVREGLGFERDELEDDTGHDVMMFPLLVRSLLHVYTQHLMIHWDVDKRGLSLGFWLKVHNCIAWLTLVRNSKH